MFIYLFRRRIMPTESVWPHKGDWRKKRRRMRNVRPSVGKEKSEEHEEERVQRSLSWRTQKAQS
jgi:hypothetical protein